MRTTGREWGNPYKPGTALLPGGSLLTPRGLSLLVPRRGGVCTGWVSPARPGVPGLLPFSISHSSSHVPVPGSYWVFDNYF